MVTPQAKHDAAGNMTTMPQPDDPASSFTASYDAWNRLVKLEDGTDVVAEYEYDGLGRRTVKTTYASGVPAETRHFYYSARWQIIEERVDGTTNADTEVQYVWGLGYVDDLVLRDRDSERFYALQDANFRVTAIVDDSGAVAERYSYTAYGQRTVLNSNFSEHSDPANGSYDFAIGHQGLMHDEESGLVYNRRRMLHPMLGRFTQRDPLGYVDGMGLYQYLRSDPVRLADAFGLAAGCVCGPDIDDVFRDMVIRLCVRSRLLDSGDTGSVGSIGFLFSHGGRRISVYWPGRRARRASAEARYGWPVSVSTSRR